MFIGPAPKRLRILHILRAPIGGLFRHVCDLAREQARMGHDVGLVCDAAPATLPRAAELASVTNLGIHRVAMSRAPDLRDILALRAIGTIATRARPHVLHGHGAKGGAYARLLRREPDRAVFYTPHGGVLHYSWFHPVGALFLAAERMLRRRGDGLIFESAFGAEAYAQKIGAFLSPTRIVPNGLRPDEFVAPPGEPAYDAVFVGELRGLKGVATLLEAAALLSQARAFRLAIAGAGPDEAAFRSMASEMGLEGSVDFLGFRKAREVFALGRVVVVPSYAESFPYIVLEAMAAGRPIVATSVGGIPEMFGPAGSALVAPGDEAALAAAIASTLDDPAGAEARAHALRERARRLYAVETMAASVTEFYAEVLSGARAVGHHSRLLAANP